MSTANNPDHEQTNPTPFSRRGFLKRVSQMGAALGLGITGVVATTKPAHACSTPYDDYKYEYSLCGSCRINQVPARVRRRYRRSCRDCAGGVQSCTAWELVGSTCVDCP